ncbi:MAG TPA: DUF5995 family protein [Acidimicrobiales bacterium]|nr:DUF5995 family protein [Acidimicrobiales bacterium]
MDAVVLQLDRLVDDARAAGDRLGWFAALYGQTTRAVRDHVAAGRFDDGERMDRFVERFAANYLAPLEGWRAGRDVPRSWRLAFEAARGGEGVVIMQHLLLGINAHVNLDLAVVSADVCPGAEITGLHDDFMRVNHILGALMPRVRACIGRFSPLLDVIDRVGGADDDEILNFSIRVARNEAWDQALVLAGAADPARRAHLVDALDRRVAVLGRVVAHPGGLLQRAVDLVAATESDDVPAVIDALRRVALPPP